MSGLRLPTLVGDGPAGGLAGPAAEAFGAYLEDSRLCRSPGDGLEIQLATGAGPLTREPDRAVVLCVDEKTQSLNLSYAKGFTHDCIRLGPATQFASLHAATREVIARCAERHRHEECLTFLRRIDGLQAGRIVPSKASVVAARP